MAREVGIHIKIYDGATAGLKKVGSAIDGFASRAKNSFKTFTSSFTTVNQGLEIMKKGFMLLDRTVGVSLQKALDFRYSWDPAKKAMIEFGQKAETLQARLGDLLIPALAGLAKAFSEVAIDVLKWGEASEKAIQKDLLVFVVELSSVLATTMVTGVHMATKAWSGLTMIWHQAAVAKASVERALIGAPLPGTQGEKRAIELEEIIDRSNAATAKAAQQQETIEERLGRIAESIGKAKQVALQYGEQFIGSVDRANTATKPLEESWAKQREAAEKAMDAAMEKIDAMIKKEAEALRAWDASRAERLRGYDALIAGYTDDVEAYQKSLNDKKAAELKAAVDRQKETDRLREEGIKKAQDEAEHLNGILLSGVNQLGSMISSAFSGIGKGGEDAARAAQSAQLRMEQLGRSMRGLSGAELQVAKNNMADLRVEAGLAAKEMVQNTKTWGDALNSLLDSMLAKLAEIAAQMVITGAINALTGGAGGFLGGALSAIGLFYKGGVVPRHYAGGEVRRAQGNVARHYSGGEVRRAYAGFQVPNTGSPGRDSVMIQAMSGERVLTRAESRNYAQTSMRGASAATAPAMNINEGGPVTNVSVNTFGGAAEVQRVIRDNLEKQRAALLRRGHIKA